MKKQYIHKYNRSISEIIFEGTELYFLKMLPDNREYTYSKRDFHSFFDEYTPPKTKKKGWVALFFTQITKQPRVENIVFPTREEAVRWTTSNNPLNGSRYTYQEIEWEEENVPDETDTI